ncbi:MAG: 7-carboxy-7-deazaguanine synthase QueE [bacterium]|nr:7-carboxy-7-deazaguanine synthase QueE [bacterium]
MSEAKSVIDDFFTQRNMPTPAWAQNLPRKMVLVITGGEPSLQSNLSAFLNRAENHFTTTQIESNGIALLANMPEHTTLVVSPKCLEKKGEIVGYLKPNKKMLERANCLKFVMSSPGNEHFSPYSTIPLWAHEWAEKTGKQIYISPMNIYKKEPQRVKTIRDEGRDLSLQERSEINEVVSFWEPGLLDLKNNQRNHEYAAEYCMKYGFILNLQLHLLASLP